MRALAAALLAATAAAGSSGEGATDGSGRVLPPSAASSQGKGGGQQLSKRPQWRAEAAAAQIMADVAARDAYAAAAVAGASGEWLLRTAAGQADTERSGAASPPAALALARALQAGGSAAGAILRAGDSVACLRSALRNEDARRAGAVPPAPGVLRVAVAQALKSTHAPTAAVEPDNGDIAAAAEDLLDVGALAEGTLASDSAEVMLSTWALAQWARAAPGEVAATAGKVLANTIGSKGAPTSARVHASNALAMAADVADEDERGTWALAAAEAAKDAAQTGNGRLTAAALQLAAACGPDERVLRELLPTLGGLCGIPGAAPLFVSTDASFTGAGARTAALGALVALASEKGLDEETAARWAPTLTRLATTATVADAEPSELLAAERTLAALAASREAGATTLTLWWLAAVLEAVASGLKLREEPDSDESRQGREDAESGGGVAGDGHAVGGGEPGEQPQQQAARADVPKDKEGYLTTARNYVSNATVGALQSVGLASGPATGGRGGGSADDVPIRSSIDKFKEVEAAFDKDSVLAARTIAVRLRQGGHRRQPVKGNAADAEDAGAYTWWGVGALLGHGKSDSAASGAGSDSGVGAEKTPEEADAEMLYLGLKAMGNLLASNATSGRHGTAMELGLLQLLECALAAAARARASRSMSAGAGDHVHADAVERQAARILSSLALDARSARIIESTAWPRWLSLQFGRLEKQCRSSVVPMQLRESLSHVRRAQRNLAAASDSATEEAASRRSPPADDILAQLAAIASPGGARGAGAAQWRYGDSIHLFCPWAANVDVSTSDGSDFDAPLIDIVFLHGLLGDPFDTWRCGRGCGPGGHQTEGARASSRAEHGCWPVDWLADEVGPRARLLSAGFKTALIDFEGHTPPLQGLSRHMLPQLLAAGVGERPVVFVTHSLGGLLCKQLLVDAQELGSESGNLRDTEDNADDEAELLRERAAAFSRRVSGVIFYSVPHFGSPVADVVPPGLALQRLARVSPAVAQLRTNLPEATVLNAKLRERLKADPHMRVLSLVETEPLNLRDYFDVGRFLTMDIVKIHSAYPGFGEFSVLKAYDHVNIVKPAVRTESSYKATANFVKERLAEALEDADAGLD